MAILTEHLGGKWPFWISPRQVIVCPISEKAADYCESVYLYLHKLGYQAAVDKSQGQISKKVRNAQLAQWNYILVAGEDEMKAGLVDVRTRDNKRHGKMRVDELADHLKSLEPEASNSSKRMYEKAWNPADFPREGESKSAGAAAANQSKKAPSVPLDKLEQSLRDSGAVWFSGQMAPSALDRENLDAIVASGVSVDPKVYPHLFGWYSLASKFSDKIKQGWK